MSNRHIGTPFSSERRTSIVEGYLANESKPINEIASLIGLEKEQLYAIKKSRWFIKAIELEKEKRSEQRTLPREKSDLLDRFSNAQKLETGEFDLYLVPRGNNHEQINNQ